MRTLYTLARGILQLTIAVVGFSIFIALEFYVVDITIDILINKHGMDTDYSKYIWGLCYIIIAFEIGVFILKYLIQNIKKFFVNIFG